MRETRECNDGIANQGDLLSPQGRAPAAKLGEGVWLDNNRHSVAADRVGDLSNPSLVIGWRFRASSRIGPTVSMGKEVGHEYRKRFLYGGLFHHRRYIALGHILMSEPDGGRLGCDPLDQRR